MELEHKDNLPEISGKEKKNQCGKLEGKQDQILF